MVSLEAAAVVIDGVGLPWFVEAVRLDQLSASVRVTSALSGRVIWRELCAVVEVEVRVAQVGELLEAAP